MVRNLTLAASVAVAAASLTVPAQAAVFRAFHGASAGRFGGVYGFHYGAYRGGYWRGGYYHGCCYGGAIAAGARATGVMDRVDTHGRDVADAVVDPGVADLGPEKFVPNRIGREKADMAEAGDFCVPGAKISLSAAAPGRNSGSA